MDKQKIFSIMLLTWLLSSCTTSTNDISTETWASNQQTDFQHLDSEEAESSLDENDETVDTIQDTELKKLSIDSKCIWCWHCARFAPNNFSMSWKKAVITSQEDISNSSVSMAISRCPVWAISID